MSASREIRSWEFRFIYIQMMFWKLNVPRALVMVQGKETLFVILYLMQMESSHSNLFRVVSHINFFLFYGFVLSWVQYFYFSIYT